MNTTPNPHYISAQRPPAGNRRQTAHWAKFATVLPVVALAGVVQAQSDNFDDGNADGWTEYSPLAAFGLSGVFSVVNGAYRIQVPAPSGFPDNPGRAGSYRADATYSDFYVAVDLVNWNNDTRQAFGVLARVGTPGLGTTTGYAFTYERGSGVTPTSGDLDISRLDGEVPSSIETGESAYHLDPTKDYRFVFTGKGMNLQGRLYELPNTDTPVMTINAADTTYASGYCGLVVYDNTGGAGVCDATFDNYFAAAELPPALTLIFDQDLATVTVTWPATSTGYRLESTPVLPALQWTEETDVSTDGFVWYHFEYWDYGNKFFRLVK